MAQGRVVLGPVMPALARRPAGAAGPAAAPGAGWSEWLWVQGSLTRLHARLWRTLRRVEAVQSVACTDGGQC